MELYTKKEKTGGESNVGDMRLVWIAAAFLVAALGIGIYLIVRAGNGAWQEARLEAEQLGRREAEEEESEDPEEEVSPDLAATIDGFNAHETAPAESEDSDSSDDSGAAQALPEPPSRTELESALSGSAINGIPQNIEKNGPFTFAVIADSEAYSGDGYNKELTDVLAAVSAQEQDFTIFTGDIITATGDLAANRKRIGAVKSLIGRYASRFYVAFGKHDLECGEPCVDLWAELLFNKKYADGERRVLYYSFNYGNTHFVLLSSDYPSEHAVDDSQLSWLDKDLEAENKENTVMIVHVPPVTFFNKSAKECHDMSCNGLQQGKLLDLIKKHNVDLVISGHEHAFDHKVVDGVDYVLAGNTGNSPRYDGVIKGDIYSLITIDNGSIVVKGIDVSGKTIREIQIK